MSCGGRDELCSYHNKATKLSRSSAPNANPWDKFDDETVETVLGWFPTADIFSCLFVCKRWDSVIHSPTFSTTSNQLFDRLPWFLICTNDDNASVVYNMEVSNWRRVQLPLPSWITRNNLVRPGIAAGGLICFRTGINCLSVCNPLTGQVRSLPMLAHVEPVRLFKRTTDYVKGVAMHISSRSKNYKVFVAFGKWPYLCLGVFSSEEKVWKELLVSREPTDGGDVAWPVERSSDDNAVDWALVKEKGAATIGNDGQFLVYYITREGNFVLTPRKALFLCAQH